ncbi:MAG: hypothetical protein AAFV53_19080 [Myxococcota bacterium]
MLSLLFWFACDVGVGDEPIIEPETEDTDTPSDGDEEADDGPAGFVPTAFTMMASVGIDPIQRTLHRFTIDGSEVAPWVMLYLVEDDSDTVCEVYFSMEVPELVPLQAWSWEDATEEAGGQVIEHLGFYVPDDARILVSPGCEEWNPDVYGELTDVLFPHQWGVGLGEIRVDVEERVNTADWADSTYRELYDQNALFGGSWSADLWEPARWASHIAYATPVDDEWTVATTPEGDFESYLNAADVTAIPGQLPQGVYQLRPLQFWDFDTYFGG